MARYIDKELIAWVSRANARFARMARKRAAEERDSAESVKAVADHMKAQAAEIERLQAKLATCEKYRDAYAECDRIGTQAVRDLEARAERLEEALLWCSGSADFNEGGVAREGWLKVCAPLLTGGKDE